MSESTCVNSHIRAHALKVTCLNSRVWVPAFEVPVKDSSETKHYYREYPHMRLKRRQRIKTDLYNLVVLAAGMINPRRRLDPSDVVAIVMIDTQAATTVVVIVVERSW